MDILKHLSERNYDINNYTHTYCTKDEVMFPLYGFDHKLNGFQIYKPNAPKKHKNPKECRYFSRGNNAHNPLFWGLEFKTGSNVYFITEGIFKSSTLHKLGYQSLALLTNDPSEKLLNQLSISGNIYIAIGDNDLAGAELIKYFKYGFLSDDIDELDLNYLNEILKDYLKENNIKV